jgi:ArsR family transcriptional regulator
MKFDCVEFCKAIGDETRQEILRLLMGGEKSVNEIVDAFNMSQPTISHHLNILKRFDLVSNRKEGKKVFYTINRDRVIECCGKLMARFDEEGRCEI